MACKWLQEVEILDCAIVAQRGTIWWNSHNSLTETCALPTPCQSPPLVKCLILTGFTDVALRTTFQFVRRTEGERSEGGGGV